MERLDDDRVIITQEELWKIADFIDSSLDMEWDRYTDNYICSDTLEDGKRRMNPDMYDLHEKLMQI